MALVQVILREDIQKLGHAGELVSVKPGFARNYLIPQGKASPATEAKIRELEHHKRVIADKLARELKDHKAVAHKIESTRLAIARRAGEDGKLFGSVTSQNIADMLAEKGVPIDRRKIQLADAIKEVGEHTIEVKLHREVTASLVVEVTIEE